MVLIYLQTITSFCHKHAFARRTDRKSTVRRTHKTDLKTVSLWSPADVVSSFCNVQFDYHGVYVAGGRPWQLTVKHWPNDVDQWFSSRTFQGLELVRVIVSLDQQWQRHEHYQLITPVKTYISAATTSLEKHLNLMHSVRVNTANKKIRPMQVCFPLWPQRSNWSSPDSVRKF